MDKPQVTIYTDGGADPNPGAGGWGAVLIFGEHIKELSGGEDHTTNNRMELTAAIRALEALKHPCRVIFYTDSQYLKNGVIKWMADWIAHDWLGSKGDLVQNIDLWQALERALRGHDVEWHWVRGHTGDRYNERADELATAARPKRLQSRDLSRPQLFLKVLPPPKGVTGKCSWAAKRVDGQNTTYYTGKAEGTNPYGMALLALQSLLSELHPPLQVMVEDELIFKGFTEWMKGWRAKNWVKPEKHNELWQELARLTEGRDMMWYWVRKDDINLQLELADLVVRATNARDRS